MRQRRVMLLLTGILIMSLWGCRTIHHYEYELVELPLLDGELWIVVNGRYGASYVKDGRKMTDHTFPYYFMFTFEVPTGHKLHKLIIRDIELVGEDTGRRAYLQDIQSEQVRYYTQSKEHVGMKYLRESAGPLTADGHEYENYTLRATVIVYRDETRYESEAISVRLVTKYWKELTNDSFDEFMDV